MISHKNCARKYGLGELQNWLSVVQEFLVSWRLILLSVWIVHVRISIVLSSWISDICNIDSGVLSCGFPQIFIVLCAIDVIPLVDYYFTQYLCASVVKSRSRFVSLFLVDYMRLWIYRKFYNIYLSNKKGRPSEIDLFIFSKPFKHYL